MVSSWFKKWVQDYSVSLSWTLIFLILLVNSVLSYVNFRSVVVSAERVRARNQAIQSTQRLLLLMLNAETGHRGYLVTGEKKYLEPYNRALQEYDSLMDRLHESFADDIEDLGMVEQIRIQASLKWDEMKRLLTTYDSKGFDSARHEMKEDKGKRYMDEVRSLVESLNSHLKEELDKESQRMAASQTQSLVMLIAGSIVLIFMSIAVFALVNRQLRYRVDMEQLLRDTNELLEKRVQHRTEALLLSNESLQQEIEERKRQEEKAGQFAEELQRSNRELEQFASVASHDLQEPLRKIQAFSDRLATKYREALEDNGKEYIDRIQASTARMRMLIEDLLSFSRVSTRGKPFSPVDLNDSVAGALVDLEARLEETGGRIETDRLPTIEADELQMRQLFLNLLGNGLKFHRPGVTPSLQIRYSDVNGVLDDTGQATLRIIDNGVGFENQYSDRIFQLFQRLHGRSEYEGTGMGLAICKKIVERHGGTIQAHGTPGQGAVFTISLPMKQQSPARKA